MKIFTNPNYDFVRWRWHAMAMSLVVILAGVAVVMTRGPQLGVDFEGGTVVVLKFEQTPDLNRIRTALAAGMPGGADAVVLNYGPPENRDVMIRVRRTGQESPHGCHDGSTTRRALRPRMCSSWALRMFEGRLPGAERQRDTAMLCHRAVASSCTPQAELWVRRVSDARRSRREDEPPHELSSQQGHIGGHVQPD